MPGPAGKSSLLSQSVQLCQKEFSFQVFCLTTGAAGHLSHKTGIVFHAVSAGMPWDSTGCQRYLHVGMAVKLSTMESPCK